jgi:hypothetical protein
MYFLPVIAATATTIIGLKNACYLINAWFFILMHDDALRNKNLVGAF